MPSLPIGLPPSPRNTIPSPAPLDQQQLSQQFKVKTPEPFVAQFCANFPSIQQPENITTVPHLPQHVIQTQIHQQQQQQSLSGVIDLPGGNSKNLDNLFESPYPDPFRESLSNDKGSDNQFIESNMEMTHQQQQHVSLPPLDANEGVVNFVQTPVIAGTPTKTNQVLIAPKIGHRRNMSDTSAFNK